MRLCVTFHYRDGQDDTHDADRLTSENRQWRLDQGRVIILVPMEHVRSVVIEQLDRAV